MPRGGKRQGSVGTQYPNRSDLQTPVPIQTAANQTYGKRAEQTAAQRALPVAPPPVASAPAPANSPSPGAGVAPSPQPLPGTLPWLEPSQRPNEPVTHGLPVGPGGGPEVLTGVGAAGFQHANTASLLSALANVPGAGDDVKALAAYAASGRA